MWSLLLPFFLLQRASAASTFSPNCTLPPEVVNFMSSTGVRGTLDILWGSLFTLLICTWTVQHLNLPEQTPDPESWQQKLKETLKRSGTKVKWMLVTLIVPEFLVGRAFQDWMMAKKSLSQMKDFAEEDDVKWTLTHAYYANMGGFILKVASSPVPNPPELDDSEAIPAQIIALSPTTTSVETGSPSTPKYHPPPNHEGAPVPTSTLDSKTCQIQTGQPKSRAELGSEVKEASLGTRHDLETSKLSNNSEKSVFAYPNADQLYILRQNSTLARLPSISVKEIQDKSKSDAFIKGTAILQVLWLVIQIIVRGAKHLPVSQLEIAVLAFAACTLLTYAFSWSKPQNITVADLASPTPVPLPAFLALEHENHQTSWFQNLTMQHTVNTLQPIPNDAEVGPLPGSEFLTYTDVGTVLAGTIFGALHLIAWNFRFPSPLESLLWKLSSVFLAAVLPFFYISAFVLERMGFLKGVFHTTTAQSKLMKIMVYLCLSSYVLVRMCLMVLVFRSLFFLDPGTFVTTWAKEVPHLQ